MNILFALSLFLLLSGCAEMQEIKQYKAEHQARAEKQAQERAEQEAADLKGYQDWYNGLSYEAKLAEDRWQSEQRETRRLRAEQMQHERELAAIQALGLINQGQGLLGPGYTTPPVRQYDTTVPTYQPRYQRDQPTQCTSRMIGGQLITDCQ